MYNLLLPSAAEGLKDILEIFKEQSDKIRSIQPAVLFEKVALNIF